MKKLFSLAFILLMTVNNLGQAPTPSWSKMVSPEGLFLVQFPVLPKRTIGRTEYFTMYTFEAKRKKETFGVSYFDAPIPIDTDEVKEQIYELGKKHHSKGRLLETKDISLGKHTGKEYLYSLRACN